MSSSTDWSISTDEVQPDELIEGAETSSGRRTLLGGNVRFLLLASAGIVVIIAAVAYGFSSEVGGSRVTRAPALDPTPGGQRQAESPRYQETLEASNDLNLAEAERAGETFIAVPEVVPQPIDVTPEEQSPPWRSPIRTSQRPAEVVAPAPAPAPPERLPSNAAPPQPSQPPRNPWGDAIAAQMGQLAGSWNVQTPLSEVLSEPAAAPNPSDGGTPPGNGGSDAPAEDANVLIPAGTIFYGQTVTSTNSDTPAPVVVEITAGEFRGARLIGGFQVTEGDRMVVQFSQIALPDGQSLSANAYAVDGRSAETAVASDVDGRYLQRYGPILAASFIAGFAESMAAVGSTLSEIGDSASVSSDEPGLVDSLFSGVAAGGRQLANEVQEGAPRGPLVILQEGWPIGVLFVDPVAR